MSISAISDDAVSKEGLTILKMIFDSIMDNNDDKLKMLLKILPLEQLDGNTADRLLFKILPLAASFNNDNAIVIIFDQWNRVYPIQNSMPLYVWLYMQSGIDFETLRYCSIVFSNYTYMEIVDNLIQGDSSPETYNACIRASKVYGQQDKIIYSDLLSVAKGVNEQAYIAIQEEVRKTATYSVMPDWIYNFTDENNEYNIDMLAKPVKPEKNLKTILQEQYIKKSKELMNNDVQDNISSTDLLNSIETSILPTSSQLKVEAPSFKLSNIPSNHKILSLIMENVENIGMTDEEIDLIRQQTLANISFMSNEEKINLIKPILDIKFKENLKDDIKLFRILGPAHPAYGSTLEEMDYGGCRMFTCDIYDEDEYGNKLDWFIGFCKICNLRIRRREDAVRMPHPQGGWTGCYCSWNCIDDDLVDTELNGSDDGSVVIIVTMIQYFRKLLYDYGIQARISEEPVDKVDIESESDYYSTPLGFFSDNENNIIESKQETKTIKVDGYSSIQIDSKEILQVDPNKQSISSGNNDLSLVNLPKDMEITNKNELVTLMEQMSDDKILLIMFYAPWCGHCKTLKPVISDIVSDDPYLMLVRLNIDIPGINDLSDQFSITAVPAVILFNNNQPLQSVTGNNIKDLMDLISEMKDNISEN